MGLYGGGGSYSTSTTPTYKADDGTTFTDVNKFNTYNTKLRRDTFNDELAAAKNAALTKAQSTLSSKGLDPKAYLDRINAEIATMSKSVPDLDGSPASYFDKDVGNYLYDVDTKSYRNQYTKAVTDAFPTNWALNKFTDTYDDSILDAI
jgi:hypothetical protein